MFPFSNNNCVGQCPNQEVEQNSYIDDRAFFNEAIEENPFSFYCLPSPFIAYNEVDLLHQDYSNCYLNFQQEQPSKETGMSNLVSGTLVKMFDSGKADVVEENSTKRAVKRDRHSKINTAQGPRDRRMRLSLKVAREFFDLQDRLGFDKASKTVEWLLNQSKAEIKKLCGGSHKMNYAFNVGVSGCSNKSSSTCECEVISCADESNITTTTTTSNKNSKGKQAARIRKPKRKSTFSILSRESRVRARERAKERTREKMRSRMTMNHESDREPNQTFEVEEQSSTTQCGKNINNPNSISMDHHMMVHEVEIPSSFEHEQLCSSEKGLNVLDESFVIVGKSSASIITLNNYIQYTQFPQEPMC